MMKTEIKVLEKAFKKAGFIVSTAIVGNLDRVSVTVIKPERDEHMKRLSRRFECDRRYGLVKYEAMVFIACCYVEEIKPVLLNITNDDLRSPFNPKLVDDDEFDEAKNKVLFDVIKKPYAVDMYNT